MRRLTALLAVLLASACADDDESAMRTVTVTSASTITVTETTATTTQSTTIPAEEWTGLPEPLAADGTLPVDPFNAHAERVDESWERDVASTAREFIGFEELEAPNVSFQAASGPEGGGPTSASLQLDGLLDDSIRARRYDLTLMKRPDGTWRIDSAFWSQRCQQGHGHQAFTPERCL
ncbi:MAG: hypothetical protein MSC30_10275 [Gaiellaceae bacterium MAG52_C11]|nr:hypothetical protein [Candidatus Gaiellasilicea maunaloa]